MSSRKLSILVVDDDVYILRFMHRTLELEGYRVISVSNGKAALDAFFEQEIPDLILLDIKMPDMDGYTVCQHIREFSKVPIIMVTAKGNVEEKVQGLDAGADDYVTKPFSSVELAARVKAVLRRTKLWDEHPQPTFYSHNLMVDFARHKITLGNHEVNLTATEYKLLSYLIRNAGRVATPDQILEKVWGEGYIGELHILRVTMARLRQKLSDNVKDSKYILTRPGIGYTMMEQPKTYRRSTQSV
ncbi:response regulator transcription factor [Chloroflexota bacterium]